MVTLLNIGENAMKLDHSYIAGGNIKRTATLKNILAVSLKKKSLNYHMTQKLYFCEFIPTKVLKPCECSFRVFFF